MGIFFVRLAPHEWPSVAEFIVDHNRRPSGGIRCLHTAHGLTAASHAAELASLSPDEAAFWTISQGKQRIGIVGCELDLTLGRAWLRGPITTEDALLDVIVHAVGPTLETALPKIKQFNAFPAADDAPLNAWYAAAGYTQLQLHHLMRADTERLPEYPTTVMPATAKDLPAVSQLHRQLFPSAYIGDADFDRAVGSAACALLVAYGQEVEPVGYLYVQDNPSDQEAYIDYLGVAESHRERGLGRALLSAAAHWASQQGQRHLALTVREDRRTALSLYTRAGFVEVSAGRHWQKALDQAP